MAAAHPPMTSLRKCLAIASLAGVVLAVHLWIQKERNFSNGCFGISVLQAAAQPGTCTDQRLDQFSQISGMPTVNLAFTLFSSLSMCAFGSLVLSPKWAKRSHFVGEAIAFLAAPAAVFLLVYPLMKTGAYCALCMASNTLVLGICGIYLACRRRLASKPGPHVPAQTERDAGFCFITGLGFAFTLLAVVFFLNRVGSWEGASSPRFESALARALPNLIDRGSLDRMRPVGWHSSAPPLDVAEWANAAPPLMGSSGAVRVFAFLDPNCPSCSQTFQNLTTLARENLNAVSIHVIVRPLWDHSVLQAQALELAKQVGKYEAMWQLQLRRSSRRGLDWSAIRSLFDELGVSQPDLKARVDATRATTLNLRSRAVAAQINSTPAIYIESRAVASSNRDLAGLRKLIEMVKSEKAVATGVKAVGHSAVR